MDNCPDCGSRHVAAVLREGVTVRECGLCGAVVGDDAEAAHVRMVREARELGIDPPVYPLVRALSGIDGIKVVRSHGGDAGALTLPFVQWTLVTASGLAQVENIAKSLVLVTRANHHHWVVEVEFQHRLVFSLKPRLEATRLEASTVGGAQEDLGRIAAALTRNRHLSWWGPVSQ